MNKPTRPPVKPLPFTASARRDINQPSTRQAQMKPVAPPVYRPQPAPKCMQPKMAHPPVTPPVASPVYSPHRAPKVLQPKTASSQASPTPKAPPVYRPNVLPKVLQRKTVMAHPPPKVLQRKIDGAARPPKSAQPVQVTNRGAHNSPRLAGGQPVIQMWPRWLKRWYRRLMGHTEGGTTTTTSPAPTTTTTTTTTPATEDSNYQELLEILLPKDVEADSKFKVLGETPLLRDRRRKNCKTMLVKNKPSTEKAFFDLLEAGASRDAEGVLHWRGNKMCAAMCRNGILRTIPQAGAHSADMQHYVDYPDVIMKPTTKVTDYTWKQFFVPLYDDPYFQKKLPGVFIGDANAFQEMMKAYSLPEDRLLVKNYVVGMWGEKALWKEKDTSHSRSPRDINGKDKDTSSSSSPRASRRY